MKIKHFLGLLVATLFISGKKENNRFSIIGEAKGFKDSTILYLHDPENNQIVDSSLIMNSNFKFSGEVNEPRNYSIGTSFRNLNEFEYVFLWVEPVDIKVSIEKGHLRNAKIEGSLLQTQASILTRNMEPIELGLDSIHSIWRSVKQDDSLKIKSLRLKQDELLSKITKVEKKYISDFPNYYHSVYILTYTMRRLPKDETRKLFNDLSENNKASKYGEIVRNYIDLSKKFELGDKAEDFHLDDLKGNKIGLCDFKGKYVLLEFWGSSCGPCRMENPNLLKNYKQFNNQGFEIISVSLDRNKLDMEKAIHKDSMIWNTVSDFQGINGLVPSIYSVTFIPKNYLINPEGIIIDMDLRGDALSKRLNEIFIKNN